MNKIEPAGYILANSEAICGVGPTADSAWENFRAEMAMAHVAVLPDGADSAEQRGSWVRESDFHVYSASAALLADVDAKGGAIAWHMRGGVACTAAEAECDA